MEVKLKIQEIKALVKKNNLTNYDCLHTFIKANSQMGFLALSKIAEFANVLREDNAAYYTGQEVCQAMVDALPSLADHSKISILEPSVGLGNFLPFIFDKYKAVQEVYLDLVDIDNNSIKTLKLLLNLLQIPNNFSIRFIAADSLLYNFNTHYDIVIGNPPYKKIKSSNPILKKYKENAVNKQTNNLFAFFIEKAISLGNYISLVVPKSLINAPEYRTTRNLMDSFAIKNLVDFGEKGFPGVKIETISFLIDSTKPSDKTVVKSFITNEIVEQKQEYITKGYPCWLIYRNNDFDTIAGKLNFGVFSAFRDRTITKKDTKSSGTIRVLKSRNIGDRNIINISNYDCYIDDVSNREVSKYLNKEGCVIIPNLSYYPRAAFLPFGCVADGSVAILSKTNDKLEISDRDLAYFSSEEFNRFYKIARNRGTRSLNIDNSSVYFFGLLKQR